MNTNPANTTTGGFTLLELLVVVAILAILAAFLIPANWTHTPCSPPIGTKCLNNQRQIMLGELLWQQDNNGQPLWLTHTKKLASPTNLAVVHYQTLTDYLKDLKAFVCPSDQSRTAASASSEFTTTNLSYLVNLTGMPNRTYTLVSGDRHLESNGSLLRDGVFSVSTNAAVHWTRELHSNLAKGIMGFADGHTEVVKDTALAGVLRNQQVATNLLAIP